MRIKLGGQFHGPLGPLRQEHQEEEHICDRWTAGGRRK